MNQIVTPNEWAAFHAKHPGKTGRGRTWKRKAEPPIVVPADVRCVLAIDPSITACGWAVVVKSKCGPEPTRLASGTWSPSVAREAPCRWVQLWNHVFDTCRDWRIETAVIEVPNANGLRRSAKFNKVNVATYGRAVGIVQGAAIAAGCRVYTPDVETWKGRSGKASTMLMVKARLGYEAKDDNEADALGLALFILDRAGANGKGRA